MPRLLLALALTLAPPGASASTCAAGLRDASRGCLPDRLTVTPPSTEDRLRRQRSTDIPLQRRPDILTDPDRGRSRIEPLRSIPARRPAIRIVPEPEAAPLDPALGRRFPEPYRLPDRSSDLGFSL